MPEIDLLSAEHGAVTAPAGCGKTQLIADTLGSISLGKPVLVLTHTNAGVGALKGRLHRAGVPSGNYRVLTIDGWAMRLIATFPGRSGHNPDILGEAQSNVDYPAIREAARGLLATEHINDSLRATYSRVIVDEYQDCSLAQHGIVCSLSKGLPTSVLGDPMQAIFNFSGAKLVDWDTDVLSAFPALGELQTPWRWRNAGTPNLGDWLLHVRGELLVGRGIDLRLAPKEVTVVTLDAVTAHQQRLMAARTKAPTADGCVLVIGDSKNPKSQRQVASQTPGAVTVEAVDLRDLTDFGRAFDLTSPDALVQLLGFADNVMTGVGVKDMLTRVVSLSRGTARKPASEAEAAVLVFKALPSLGAAAVVLDALASQADSRRYRPMVLRACVRALNMSSSDPSNFFDATVREREQYRHMGRPTAKRAVGSTLLLKGLEADVAVVLNPETMNAKHLYVALTRGARRLVVCSDKPIIPS